MKSCACIDTYCGLCYNKRKKGGVFVRKILDKLFENKKLAFWIPIAFAAVAYLLFALFGSSENKGEDLIGLLILTVAWFFGVFLVFFAQVKNPRCPEKFLDFFELLVLVGFVPSSLIGMFIFLFSGFQNFDFGICVGAVTYSTVSWVHSKREKIADKE